MKLFQRKSSYSPRTFSELPAPPVDVLKPVFSITGEPRIRGRSKDIDKEFELIHKLIEESFDTAEKKEIRERDLAISRVQRKKLSRSVRERTVREIEEKSASKMRAYAAAKKKDLQDLDTWKQRKTGS